MIHIQSTFSGFSVNDLSAAKQFYSETLGLKLTDAVGGTTIHLPGGAEAWMYEKADHVPAGYTMLDFKVSNIDEAHDEPVNSGAEFEHYPNSYQDEKGIMRGKDHNMGPNIAWFKDPAGNILAILES
ncbi:MAG: VOC family protein [Candidatus Saccharimonadales bacterium]